MKVVVVGAGISGLTAAYSILKARPDIDLTVLESSEKLGGVISTRHEEDCVIEEGPDSFLSTKPWAIDLCLELGLADQVIQTNDRNRRAFVASNDTLVPLPEGFFLVAPTKIWPFIDSPILSAHGKLAGLLEVFKTSSAAITDESLKDFIVRRFGLELFERIAQPMAAGIYTGDPEKLSAASTLPQFVEMERKYGSITKGLLITTQKASKDSGARYSAFVTLKNGLQSLVGALGDKIGRNRIELRCALQSLSASEAGWKVITSNGNQIDADAVVLALPAQPCGLVVKDCDASLSGLLLQVQSSSTAIINLLFDLSEITHPLDGFGFVVPELENRSILACSFSSRKFASRAPSDKALLRVFLGGALHPETFAGSDGDLIKAALTDLRRYLGITSYPEQIWLKRWKNSMPQYHVGHEEILAQIKTRFTKHSGLIWAGSALTGVGIPDCVRAGLSASQQVLELKKANQ